MKKVLLIAPCFFDYYKRMIEELEGFGYNVDYIEDKPSSNTLFRAVARVNKNLVKPEVKSYFKKVLGKAEKERYDIVLLVAGMSFTFDKEMIGKLRACLPDAQFVMYQWDSVENLKYPLEIKEYFDSCYSFDSRDVKKYDFLQFLPLFYTRCYEKIGEVKSEEKYDCVYVGTAHKNKFAPVNSMAEKLKEVYPSQMIYHYMPSVFKFLYQKLFYSEFKNTKKTDFQYDKISNAHLLEFLKTAKCVLDAPQAHQIGLTIRTIECLGAKKKLITTNKDIVNYDFYNPKNIYVYDGEFDFTAPFFTEKYENVEKEVYEKYALRNWIKTMVEPVAR